MEQFIEIYFIIGLIIFMFLISAMYIIGFENIKKEIKDLNNSSEFSIVIGILIFSLILWPLIVFWMIQQKFK
jgi:hypothetical protein